MTSPLEQKIKITGPVVVTANRVGDGVVIYRRADGGWSTDLDAAAIATNAATAGELVNAAIADDLRAVGSYIAPVKLSRDGEVRPGNLRELIRLRGPTIDLPVMAGIKGAIPQQPAHAQT
jgi:predicted NAD/FAD-binding protein